MLNIDLSSLIANGTSPKYDGTYINGDRPATGKFTITKSGGGFGTKPTGTPYFDNFENRTVGAASSNSLGGTAGLNISNPNYVSIANTGSYSGTKVVKMDYAAASVAAAQIPDPSSNLLFPKIYRELGTPSRYGYAAFWIKWTGSGGAGGNVWKFSRFTSGSVNPYSDDNLLSFTYVSDNNISVPQTFSGDCKGSITPFQYKMTNSVFNPITEVPNYNPATLFTKDVWHLYEVELDVGTVNTANALVEERWDKTLTCRYGNSSNLMTFKTTANPQDIYSIMSPMCGLDDYSNIVMYMDEAYIDGSRCRVVMTDSPVYTNWTKWAIQPCTSSDWTDTTLNPTRNYSNFTMGSTVYYHVFNSLGVLVYSSPGEVLV
jgi:hypothetical protein